MSNIIVSGIPRCGTTAVSRAIAGMKPGDGWPIKDLSTFTPVGEDKIKVIKTHFPYSKRIKAHKAIFLFGDPVKAVISFRKNRWDHNSFKNCLCTKPIDQADIFKEDILSLERIFDTWTSSGKELPTLVLRYETMHMYPRVIQEWVGERIQLPSQKIRKTSLADQPKEVVEQIRKTYKSLIEKINNYPHRWIVIE